MNIKQNLVSPSKYSIKCPYEMNAEFIVVHNTANDAPAENEIKYMISNDNKVSFHYAVDDKEIVQGIPENRNAYHAGDGSNGQGNRKGLAIEICYSKNGGERFIQAEKNAAEFIAMKLKEKGWGIDKVKRHKDFSGKYCPHRTMDIGWSRFLDMIKSHLNTTTSQPVTGYTVKITTDVLNVRSGAGTNYPVTTTVKKGEVYTIVEEKKNGSTLWGKLKSGAGWISLAYTDKVSTAKYTAGSYEVTASALNVREKPTTDSRIVTTLKRGSKQGIDKTSGDWGHILNNAGWINLDYCKKI